MNSIQAMLAVVCLFTVGGAIDAARADDRAEENQAVTLYTTRGIADTYSCSAVNVSDKTLGMTFAVLDNDGNALSCASPTTCSQRVGFTTNPTPELSVPPGTVAEINIFRQIGSVKDAYCMVAVSGTGDRNDVRISLVAALTRTIPGTTTPVFVSRVFEGH